jgi:hypothetical protein
MKIWTIVLCCALAFAVLAPALFQQGKSSGASVSPTSPILRRRYHDGEAIDYMMKASNRSPLRSIQYSVRASGTVKKNAAGALVEEFGWSGLTVNDVPTALTPGSQSFRQTLALSPDYIMAIPPLGGIQPMLIGPVVDLLTFYADLSLAMRQSALTRVADHVYFKHGSPNSWADGAYVVLGEDSIDFDMTLRTIDQVRHIATIVVRHVPPVQPEVRLPTAWMESPVADTRNNWVEVSKSGDHFAAKIGKETFEVKLTVDLVSGRLIAAAMDNPVDVLERDCTDAALTNCGEPNRYRILRTVSIVEAGRARTSLGTPRSGSSAL